MMVFFRVSAQYTGYMFPNLRGTYCFHLLGDSVWVYAEVIQKMNSVTYIGRFQAVLPTTATEGKKRGRIIPTQ
jgi:hypothetical protein